MLPFVYLWIVGNHRFTIETTGGAVSCEVSPDGKSVTVDMGEVSFNSKKIPVMGEPREVLNEEVEIDGQVFVRPLSAIRIA
jgi:diaminopimelate epimerase